MFDISFYFTAITKRNSPIRLPLSTYELEMVSEEEGGFIGVKTAASEAMWYITVLFVHQIPEWFVHKLASVSHVKPLSVNMSSKAGGKVMCHLDNQAWEHCESIGSSESQEPVLILL